MFIYQDYLESQDKNKFIVKCISEHIASKEVQWGLVARKYYQGENHKILNRMNWLYNELGAKEVDNFKANNRVPSEFLKKIILQENSYLLGNGVTLDDKIKKDICNKFDIKLQDAGIDALIEGKAWLFCYIDKDKFDFNVFTNSEFVPLYDEETGYIVAGIRHYCIKEGRSIYIELYEIDGVTKFKTKKLDGTANLELYKPKTSYIINKEKNIIDGERIVCEKNWSRIPVFPLYANRNRKSELTVGLKNKIDLYDIVLSDFGNNLEDSQDVYWVLKNYQGQDLGEFLEEFKRYKAIPVTSDEDGNDGDATPHTIEVPYQARETALKLIEKRIYKDAMALDTETVTGSSLTNVVIKAAFTDLNTKCDGFENCVLDTLTNIIDLYKEYRKINKDVEPKLIRRELVNDTELIDNIVKFRNDIDWRTSLELNPYISTKDIDVIEKRMEEESSQMFNRGATPDYMQQEEEDNKPNKANEEE